MIEILCGKSNQEIHIIREAYQRSKFSVNSKAFTFPLSRNNLVLFLEYGTNLESAMRSELSGDFGHLMRAVLAGGRDERMEVDIPKAERDAQVRF